MAVFSPDQNYSQQAAQAPISFGNPALNQYVQYYQDLVAANGGQPSWGAGNDLSGINRGSQMLGQVDYAPNIDGTTERGWGTNRGVQDMSTPDRFFASLAKFGDTIAGAGGFNGWDENKGAGENIGSFITSLPTGMASAPFSGVASLYEGITGKPVTQSDLESNQMAGEDLTGFQRAGAIGTGLVDTLGLFLGGSAEALNAARNVTRAARGKDAAAPIGAAASRFMGRGAGAIAVDTLEEGAEEAFQSVMEDVRHDRLDEGSVGRALEGAVYGAAGGAVMSAGGQVVNSALGSGNATTSALDEAMDAIQSPVFEAQQNKDHLTGGPLSAGAVARRMELLSENRDVSGSANQVSATYSGNIGLLDAHVGIDAFKGIMQSGVEGSQEVLAKKLGTDVDNLVRISSLPEGQAVLELNNLIDNQVNSGNKVKITINRTPASNNQIIADFNLKRFVPGNQIGLNRAAYTFYRSDVDGDQMMVYFDPHVEAGASVIQNLVRKIDGNANYDADYLNVFNNTSNIDQADAALSNIAELLDNNGVLSEQVSQRIEKIKSVLNSEVDTKTKSNNFASEMSYLVTDIQKVIFNSRYQAAQSQNPNLSQEEINTITRESWDVANDLAAQYWDLLEYTSRDTFDEFDNCVKKLSDEEKNLLQEISQVMEIDELSGLSAGTPADASLMGIFVSLGYQIDSYTDLANPFYRQFPETYIASHASKYMNQNKSLSTNHYAKLAAMTYRMRDVGCDVQTAIEGIFRLAVRDAVMARMGELRTHDISELEKVFKEEYNKAVKHFNDAWKKIDANTGNNPNLQGAPRFDKKDISDNDFHMKFLEVFGITAVNDFIPVSSTHDFSNGISFDLALEAATTNPAQFSNPFTMYDNDVKNFWLGLLKAYGAKQSIIGSKIETSLDGFHDITKRLRDYGVFDIVNRDGNIESVPSDYIPELTSWIEAAVRHLGIDGSIYYNIDSVVGLLNTSWGKALVTAGNANDFKKAVASFRLSYTYRLVFEGLDLIEAGNEAEGRKLIEISIRDNANTMGDLSMAIYHEYRSRKGMTLLHRLTDLSVSYVDNVREYEHIMAKNVGSSNYLSAVYKVDSSTIGLSALTNDIYIADRSANKALRQTNGYSIAQIKAIRELTKDGDKHKITTALKRLGQKSQVRYTEHALTAAVMSARHGDKQEVDKGTSSLAEMLLWMHQNLAKNGSALSAVDRMNVAMGTMELNNFVSSRTEFLRVILDPTASIRVYDQETGSFRYITQEVIYSDYGITETDEDERFLQLLEAEPQLITYFTQLHNDPVYVGSDATMVTGMAKHPVDAVKELLENATEDYLISESEIEAQNFLLNSPTFGSDFILTLPQDVLTSNNPQYVRQEVRKNMKHWTDYLLWYASIDDGLASKHAAAINQSRKFNEVWKQTHDILSEISIVRDAISRGAQFSSYKRQVEESITNSIFAQALVKQLSDIVGEENIGKINVSQSSDGAYDTLETLLKRDIEQYPDILAVLFQIGDFEKVIDSSSDTTRSSAIIIFQTIFDSIDHSNLSQSAINKVNNIKKKFGAVWNGNSWDYSNIDPHEISALFSSGLKNTIGTISNNGIILDNKFFEMSSDEAVEAIKNIVVFSDYSYDLNEKDVRDIFDKNNQEGKEELFKTYNNAILSQLLKSAASSTGLDIHDGIAYSALSSFEEAETLAKDFAINLTNKGVKLSPRQMPRAFSWNFSPLAVASATNMQFKLEGSGISTGVAVDASMIKNIAASSAFDPHDTCGVEPVKYSVTATANNQDNVLSLNHTLVDMQYIDFDEKGNPVIGKDGNPVRKFITNIETLRNRALRAGLDTISVYHTGRCLCGGACGSCGTKSHNPASSIHHVTAGDIEAVLLKFMMEEMHLKRRKSVGKLKQLLYTPPQIHKGISAPINIAVRDQKQFREVALEYLQSYRKEISDSYLSLIQDPDLVGLKDLDELNTFVMANLATPYFNVLLSNGESIRINTADLKNEDILDLYEIDPSLVSSIVFESVSLNEVAARQMRHSAARLEQEKASDPNFSPTKSDYYRWSKEATNWKDAGSLNAKDIFARIPELDMATYAGAYVDMSPTSSMQWYGDTIEELSSIFSQDNTKEASELSKTELNAVSKATDIAINEFGISGYAIAKFTDDFVPKHLRGTAILPQHVKHIKEALGGGQHLEKTMYIRLENSPQATRVADFLNNRNSFRNDVDSSVSNGHAIIVTKSNIQEITDILKDKGIVANPVQIKEGSDYYVFEYLNPSDFDLAKLNTSKIAIENLDDPVNDILWDAVDTGFMGTTDAQTFIFSDTAKRLKFNVSGETNWNIDELFEKHRFENMWDKAHVASKAELNEINIDNLDNNIDFTFWEKRTKGDISTEAMKESVRVYLRNLDNIPEAANFRSNIGTGECIGFVRKGQIFVPIFYFGGQDTPSHIDAVAFGIDDYNNISLKIKAHGGFDNTSRKIGLYGLAFKSMATVLNPEEEANWPAFETFGHLVYTRPDMVSNEATLSGRTAMKTGKLAIQNIYAYTRGSGTNLLYEFEIIDGKMVAKRRSDLNNELGRDELISLANGGVDVWSRVCNGTLNIYDKSQKELNAAIARIASEVVARTGSYVAAAEFFNSRFYTEGTKFENSNNRLTRHWVNPAGISKNMLLDDVLLVFNHMDSSLCPRQKGLSDNLDTIFDDQGRRLLTTKDGPKRFVVVGGLHYYTDQASEMKDYSRSASYSMQTVVMSMLNSGIFNSEVENLINYLELQIGDTSPIATKERELALEKYDDNFESGINQALYQRVSMNMGDPALVEKAHAYRETCLKEGRDLVKPIELIATAQDKTDALDKNLHPELTVDLETLKNKFNEALQITDEKDKVTIYELLTLARYAMGYSYNSGEFTSITMEQFKDAVARMVESIKSKRCLPIPSDKYKTAMNDVRIPISTLMPDLARRLWNSSPRLQDPDAGYSTYEEFVEAMFTDAASVTMREIAALKNVAKQKALMHLVDATAYAHGRNTISGHVLEDVYIDNVIEYLRNAGPEVVKGYDIDIVDVIRKYDESKTVSKDFLERADALIESRTAMMHEDDLAWGGVVVNHKSTDENVAGQILRNLVSLRKIMGVMYLEMPLANGAERVFNQGTMSLAVHLGTLGLPLYKNTKHAVDPELKYQITHDDDVKTFWAAMREAQLYGLEKDLLAHLRNAQDITAACNEFFAAQGKLESFANAVMNYASAKNFAISGQIGLFIDRMAMRIEDEMPWLGIPNPETGETFFKTQLRSNPVKFIVDSLNGTATEVSASAVIARECFNWALRGDMAQKNLISAIYSEIAKRSAGASFFTTAFITPYFNYATNRFGRIMQWVMPVSSMHHLLVKYFTQGYGAGWKVPGLDITFGELVLEDAQLTKDMKEAVTLDVMHLGPQLIAIMLLGMGALEPPEDEDKWGNFKEWTIFGARVDANWWLEDMLGLALPYAAFGASCREGKPRLDLITNGIAYYLSNNPVVKVADAVEVLFDPMAELTQLYDNDIENYAKAMGGPPSFQDVLNGRMTSFGLSFVAQFITPGVLREIYNQGQRYEASYKRIFQEGQYGKQTSDGEQGDKTQYTEYHDAIVRKYTRNNPVMGFLADMILRPETGYMAHEMPRNVIYDPFQMDAINYFSLYNDPFNKSEEKSDIEKEALAIEAIGALQTYSIDELKSQGFALDYDTKEYISKYIWDIIANLNAQYQEFQNSDASNFYYWGSFEEGKAVVNEIKSAHYALVDSWKSLYYDKLWSDELTIAKYNRLHTTYATDDNGEVYATGYYPNATIGGFLPWPVSFAPGESPGPYQQNMGREFDWQTESIVTGEATGQRGLVPLASEMGRTPSIDSWSTDGTDTGLSDRAANKTSSQPSGGSPSGNGTNDSGIPNATTGKGTRYSSGGGYSRRSGGGGGGGGGSAPNIYSRVNAPNISNPDTMRGARIYDANYDAIRPNFETKGSREAYKRSDI